MKRLLVLAILAVAACREDVVASIPAAVTMSDEQLGYYCQMNLSEHPGPKGQIHLSGYPVPIFFSQARDVVAYLREPERVAPITAVYVSNMSRAANWDEPGADNWILAQDAFYVVGSDATGGMGAPEVVPFETEADALAFVETHGGQVMRLDDIPTDAVLGGVERELGMLMQEDRP